MEPEDEVIQEPWWSRYKWLLAAGLALLVALIVVIVVLATQPHHHKAKPTATPSPTPTATAKPTSTPNPTPRPTASPTSHSTPVAQPTPTPSPTPSLTPIPTVTGLGLGYVHRTPARIRQIQTYATQGRSGYKVYLSSVKSLQYNLPSYGFTGSWKVIQPSQPSPTPTVSPTTYTTGNGIPAQKYIVQYQGHTYEVIQEQLANHGSGGVWLIWQVGPQLT